MREAWAGMQNEALETRGDRERPAEVKLGLAASAIERWAMREAEAEGTKYEPVTEWLRAALDGARSVPPGGSCRPKPRSRRPSEMEREQSLGRDLDDGLEL